MKKIGHKKCKCNKSILSAENVEYLRRIGLSKNAIDLYSKLLILGPLTAQDAATHTLDFPSAQYRLLYLLESKELVRKISGRPVKFQALNLDSGLRASFIDNKQELAELIGTSSGSSANERAKVIIGRQAVYDTYMKYAAHAKERIYIFSIGIAYSKKLHDTQQLAISRGVDIYHVVQEVRPANYHVVNKWRKIGVKIKEMKQNRGYHLVIIDKTCAIVTFSDPDDTEDRVSIVTENEAIISIFDKQFEAIWQDAKKIKI